MTTAWRNGKARTVAKQIDGLTLPPSSCCVHALPWTHLALSEEALSKVKKQHERGLGRGSGRCLQNIRSDLEETFRSRCLPVLLFPSSGLAGDDESKAVASTSEALAGKDIKILTTAAIIDELNQHLPGQWALEQGGVGLCVSTRRLCDALAPPSWGTESIPIQARVLPCPESNKSDAPLGRNKSLRETYSKVEARRRGTAGTPEAGNAERVLKKLKVLMRQEAP